MTELSRFSNRFPLVLAPQLSPHRRSVNAAEYIQRLDGCKAYKALPSARAAS